MTFTLLQDLQACLRAAFTSVNTRILVLQAAGPHFCTGARYHSRASTVPLWWVRAQDTYSKGLLLDQLRSVSISTVSLLQGASVGGGLILGLAADLRMATRSASFRLGVAPHSLSPVMMATGVLPNLVGYHFSI